MSDKPRFKFDWPDECARLRSALKAAEEERDAALMEHTDMMWQRRRAEERAEAAESALAATRARLEGVIAAWESLPTLCTTAQVVSKMKPALERARALLSAPADGNTVSDERFAEIKRAQAIIDGLTQYREALLTCPFESTPEMRLRICELAMPERDDFDRAVMCLLRDFEKLRALLSAADGWRPEDDGLRPCPFCGGAAERVDNGPTKEQVQNALSWGQDFDDGGSFIHCTVCDASSPVHFERKESLADSWNSRGDYGAAARDDGWRTIDSAPRDSKARLVWCPAFRNTYIVSWIVPLGEDAKPDPASGFWAHFGSGSSRLNERPTHYRPLPAPPSQEDIP